MCHNKEIHTLIDVYDCFRHGGEERAIDEEDKVKVKKCH
jgi:hypothetical protein